MVLPAKERKAKRSWKTPPPSLIFACFPTHSSLQAVYHCGEWSLMHTVKISHIRWSSNNAFTVYLLLCFCDNSLCQPLTIAYSFSQRLLQRIPDIVRINMQFLCRLFIWFIRLIFLLLQIFKTWDFYLFFTMPFSWTCKQSYVLFSVLKHF